MFTKKDRSRMAAMSKVLKVLAETADNRDARTQILAAADFIDMDSDYNKEKYPACDNPNTDE